jgi:hypothetical protein
MAMPAFPLPSLAIHLPAALHLAGVGQPSQGLNAFLVAIYHFPFLATPPLDMAGVFIA